MASRTFASSARRLLLLAALCLALVSVTAEAVNVVAFASAIQSALRTISPGFVTYYSALVGTPAAKAQFCTTSIANMVPGLALTMESIDSPYGLLATPTGLIVYKDNYVYGPTINLIGTSYRIADGTPATNVQTGNSLLMPYTENSIIMVTGTITNGTKTNILPMARYMIVDRYLCSSMYADTTSFSTSLGVIFNAFAAAAVAS